MAAESKNETAIFAGGCFWCVEHDFKNIPGVISAVSGYTGGHVDNPTYEQVSHENTGHKESVLITFDPTKITYQQLLDHYWVNIDPFDDKGQFCDKGDSYKAMIFYMNDEQKKLAEASKEKVQEILKKPVATQIVKSSKFYPAEDYHQQYSKKNPVRYKFYRYRCGRDSRLEEVWGKKAGQSLTQSR